MTSESPAFISLVARRESPLFVSLIIAGFHGHFRTALNLDFAVGSYKYESGEHQISVHDARRLDLALRGAIESRADFYPWYVSVCRARASRLAAVGDVLASRGRRKLSRAALTNGWRCFATATKNMVPFLLTTVRIERLFEEQLRAALSEYPRLRANPKLINAIISELQSHSARNETIQEIRGCHGLAQEIAADAHLKSSLDELDAKEFLALLRQRAPHLAGRLRTHAKKFGWILTHGYRLDPMSETDLVHRIRNLAKKALAHPEPEEKVALSELVGAAPTPKLAALVETLESLIALRFDRIAVHLQAFTAARPFFQQIAGKFRLNIEDLIWLTEAEVDRLFKQSMPASALLAEIRSRQRRGFAVYLGAAGIQTVAGELERSRKHGDGPILLAGRVASQGAIAGRARVIMDAKDAGTVVGGDILVTSMTTPDFMPALERCAGVITDEGGILCHAAVIARELSIPCLTATGVATKRIKDRAVTELNAEAAADNVGIALATPWPNLRWLPPREGRQIVSDHDSLHRIAELADLLTLRLQELITSGRGLFGVGAQQQALRAPHEGSPILLRAPPYWFTYWGWQIVPRLLPDDAQKWAVPLAEQIQSHLPGAGWIIIQDGEHEMRRPRRSIRHTIKGAHILQQVADSLPHLDAQLNRIVQPIVNSVAWRLVEDADEIMHVGGLREFADEEAEPCVYTSSYAYCFLQYLLNRHGAEVVQDWKTFTSLANQTQGKLAAFLRRHWNRHNWKYHTARVTDTAPLILVGTQVLGTELSFSSEVRRHLMRLVNRDGTIRADPNSSFDGSGISSLSLSVRMAFALLSGGRTVGPLPPAVQPLIRRLLTWPAGESSISQLPVHEVVFFRSILDRLLMTRFYDDKGTKETAPVYFGNAGEIPSQPAKRKEAKKRPLRTDRRSRVFISYSHKDTPFLNELLTHLVASGRNNRVDAWTDQELKPGVRWLRRIKKAVASARVAVFMVSRDFLSSEFIIKHELTPFLRAADTGQVSILWFLVGDCLWQDSPLREFQAAFPTKVPLARMRGKRDVAYVEICRKIDVALAQNVGGDQ
ncbi:MAG: TIR domain-containing protein [Verrucomicrobia bacterium]|nr:TIR domain-containing protein [Verrucomicrobiota bacterium]